jgi:hypothetical protein
VFGEEIGDTRVNVEGALTLVPGTTIPSSDTQAVIRGNKNKLSLKMLFDMKLIRTTL